MMTRKAILRF